MKGVWLINIDKNEKVELNSRQKREPKIQTHFCLNFSSIWRISMLLDLTN